MSLIGCSKDWLELDQPGNIDKPYFVDGETAYEAVIAAYDVQAWRNNLVSLWAVGSVMSDDAVKGGESNGDQSGYSVSLNADGDIVAIGAPYNDGNGFNSGHVRVYQYISNGWRFTTSTEIY